MPPYAALQLGDEEEEEDGVRRKTGRRVIADRPGRPSRQPAAQRMAGPIAPELEAPDAAVGAPHVLPDEIDADGDAALAEDSAEVTNGSGNGDAETRRAERRRQQRAKRKHGRP